MERKQLIELTADIVSAHVSNNHVAVGDITNLVERVYASLSGLESSDSAAPEEKKKPAVSVRASIKPDHLICLECGRKQKTLKRHLAAAHGLTPEQYRSAYGLGPNYPMAAPHYSEQRRTMAKAIGLGRRNRPQSGRGSNAGASATGAEAGRPAGGRKGR